MRFILIQENYSCPKSNINRFNNFRSRRPVIINIRSIGLPDGPYSTTLDHRDGTFGCKIMTAKDL